MNAERLIKRYYDGMITPDELRELQEIVATRAGEDEELIMLSEMFRMESEQSRIYESLKPDDLEDRIMQRIAGDKVSEFGRVTFKQRIMGFVAAAAVVCIVMVGGIKYVHIGGEKLPSGSDDLTAVVEDVLPNEGMQDSDSDGTIKTAAVRDPGKVKEPTHYTEQRVRIRSSIGSDFRGEGEDKTSTEPEYSEAEIQQNRAELEDCLAFLGSAFNNAYNDYEETVDEMSVSEVIMKL